MEKAYPYLLSDKNYLSHNKQMRQISAKNMLDCLGDGQSMTFLWAQGPKFWGEGKGAKTEFFYVALASHIHHQQPSFLFNHSIQ